MKFVLVLVLAIAPACLDAAKLKRAVRAGSEALDIQPIIDGHNDLPWNLRNIENNQLGNFNFSGNLQESETWNCESCFTDLPRLRKGKVGAQFWVAYVSCNSQYKDAVEQTLEQIDVIKRLVAAYPNDLMLATSAADIREAMRVKKIASLICVEGGHSVDSRLSVLRLMYEMGARYMTITHSCNTPWADSSPVDDPSGTPEHNGLSAWGKTVIEEMNRLGMMVDLSHVSAKTMKDVLAETKAPVIFSHSSARAICNHHRNVPDDVLELVAINKGVVMVNFYSRFIQCDESKNATIDDVVAHINHIRTVTGSHLYVGIGGDYDGVDEMPDGLEDVSKYPDLFDKLALSEIMWTSEELQALAGGNLLRVLDEVERIRDTMKAQSPVEKWIPNEDLGKNTGCRTDIATQGGSDSISASVAMVVATALYSMWQ